MFNRTKFILIFQSNLPFGWFLLTEAQHLYQHAIHKVDLNDHQVKEDNHPNDIHLDVILPMLKKKILDIDYQMIYK